MQYSISDKLHIIKKDIELFQDHNEKFVGNDFCTKGVILFEDITTRYFRLFFFLSKGLSYIRFFVSGKMLPQTINTGRFKYIRVIDQEMPIEYFPNKGSFFSFVEKCQVMSNFYFEAKIKRKCE